MDEKITNQKENTSNLILSLLKEREKELNCIYKIQEALANIENLESIMPKIINIIPQGWQYSENCFARIIIEDKIFEPENFYITPWHQKTNIVLEGVPVGSIEVYYTQEFPPAYDGPFLLEEKKLLDNIANIISNYLLRINLKKIFSEWQLLKKTTIEKDTNYGIHEWKTILEVIKDTDQHLFSILSRKMINYLFCRGIKEAQDIFQKLGTNIDEKDSIVTGTEINRPSKKQVLENSFNLGIEIFSIASQYLVNDELLLLIKRWIYEEKSHFLAKALADQTLPLSELSDAIRRYYHINPLDFEKKIESISPVNKGIRVSLIRRFLTDQLQFIEIAKNYVEVKDFYELLQNMIFPNESYGKLGGKTSGLFLGMKILEKSLGKSINIKTPKTWYIPSDGTYNFIYYNNLEDIIEQKYKPIEEIRQEYPYIVQAFKNSHLSPEILNGLSRALDDFGNKPIIVRSSSLLEDRLGTVFAGKYKSLFLGNQGTKKERLEALMDAIAEVYASIFSPDPIGYRIEKGLLDFHEEMGIMIQEVVGKKVGKYFFPAFAGVAFSKNEFRWSPRISRDDGLIRIVPGLGTRAVDRIASDYPILIAPGKPDLRVNLSIQDALLYSPKNIDVINLETNSFETLPINQIIKEVGNEFPMLNDIFSIIEENNIIRPFGLGIDTKKHNIVVTFDNLIHTKRYIKDINLILKTLSSIIGTPIDIEFACDGKDLYLLQCRPQSNYSEIYSTPIPKNVPKDQIIFTANKYISGGKVPDIQYIIYVDPQSYLELKSYSEMKQVGYIISKLNQLLPKKSFILMGPGRWGSRDDIRLGVSVTYSDINNTAMLIEVARAKGNYIPDLSFGTHFFQDLVESSIYYLPLYPDSENIIFNQEFLSNSENILERLLPEYNHFKNVVKVINIPEVTNGKVCKILMDIENDEAICFLTNPSISIQYKSFSDKNSKIIDEDINLQALHWRLKIVEFFSKNTDRKKFGIVNMYLFGTVFHKTAGLNSDIDILIHFRGSEEQRKELKIWCEALNSCLSEINFQNTGYRLSRFLDCKILDDEELKSHKYYQDLINDPLYSKVI